MANRDGFKVIGVDLGAQRTNTAYCVLAVGESQGTVTIESPKEDQEAADDKLLEAFSGAARVGIDAPFGWPVKFNDAISGYRDSKAWPSHVSTVYPGDKRSKIEYRDLKYRRTDLYVWEKIDKRPLGVATELIGSVAIRAARLLARANVKHPLEVDRSGQQGRFVEVYPAAAFKQWGIQTNRDNGKRATTSYKKDPEVRKQMLRDLSPFLDNWLQDPDEYWRTDHRLDALVSALVTLMAELDCRLAPNGEDPLLEPIPPDMKKVAKKEGWIALPRRSSLRDLGVRVQELMNARNPCHRVPSSRSGSNVHGRPPPADDAGVNTGVP